MSGFATPSYEFIRLLWYLCQAIVLHRDGTAVLMKQLRQHYRIRRVEGREDVGHDVDQRQMLHACINFQVFHKCFTPPRGDIGCMPTCHDHLGQVQPPLQVVFLEHSYQQGS